MLRIPIDHRLDDKTVFDWKEFPTGNDIFALRMCWVCVLPKRQNAKFLCIKSQTKFSVYCSGHTLRLVFSILNSVQLCVL